ILRDWQDSDRVPYAAFNVDPDVRRYFYPETKTTAETNEMVDGMIAALAADGFGFLAIERKSDGAFIGDAGLTRIDAATRAVMPNPGDIEIGWLLGKAYWGQGYATEAARAWLDYAFGSLNLPELVSFTQAGNLASQRAMEKLGMVRDDAGAFEDPTVPEGHWQRPHVIYRIARPTGRA
ncbi:MAG: GNAT family N-acetyltransferase, partial [Devosia sp.]